MPHTPVAAVSAHLWDLRAQCEQQVRALTDAQQQLDVFRDGTDPVECHIAALAVASYLSRVVETNATVSTTLSPSEWRVPAEAIEHAQ